MNSFLHSTKKRNRISCRIILNQLEPSAVYRVMIKIVFCFSHTLCEVQCQQNHTIIPATDSTRTVRQINELIILHTEKRFACFLKNTILILLLLEEGNLFHDVILFQQGSEGIFHEFTRY